jgi:hypothetical protein
MLKKSPSPLEMNNLIHALNSGDFASAETLASALSDAYPKAVLV